MSKWLSILKKILIYEDKPEFNNFELLETENEGEKNEYGQKPETQNSKPSDNDTSDVLKTPLKVDEWNKSKKEEKNNKPSALGGMLDTDLNKNIQLIEKEFNIPENQDAIIKDFNVARKIKAVICCYYIHNGSSFQNLDVCQVQLEQEQQEGSCWFGYFDSIYTCRTSNSYAFREIVKTVYNMLD